MDDTKILLPSWLPWATTACLAALVACLGELWILERARTRVLRDENVLAAAALKEVENQLEAERILGRRERGERSAEPGTGSRYIVAPLTPPQLTAPEDSRPWGVLVWATGGKQALLKFSGMPGRRTDRGYQLWMVNPGAAAPSNCGTFDPPDSDGAPALHVTLASPVEEGGRFLLIEGKREGYATLEAARAEGSIVLATLPFAARISSR